MKSSLFFLLLTVETPKAWAFLPAALSWTGQGLNALGLSRGDDEDATMQQQPLQEIVAAPRNIQPIQPGMQDVPLYEQPRRDPSSNNDDDDDNGGAYRIINGRKVSSGTTPRSDTSNLLSQNRNNYTPTTGQEGERIQGNSLRTYSNMGGGGSPTDTHVHLSTQGRPIHADLQMWAGPNNTPQSVKVYSQDGSQYGISTSFRGRTGNNNNNPQPNSVSIRNEGNMEFPLTTQVMASSSLHAAQPNTMAGQGGQIRPQQQQGQAQGLRVIENEGGVLLQGEGMVRTFPVAANVQSVQVILQSAAANHNHRRLPIMAKVELLQGPNNVKTLAEIYDDGMHGDYFETIMDTPGFSSSVRITNTGPMTYPFHVLVVPYTLGDPKPLNSNELASGVARSRFGPDGQFQG